MGSVPANSPPLEAVNSPPLEGCQAPLDGMVVWVLYQLIPLLWRGGRRSLTGWFTTACAIKFTQTVANNSPPLEGRCPLLRF